MFLVFLFHFSITFSAEIQPDDEWSDSDDDEAAPKDPPNDLPSARRRIRALEGKLIEAKKNLLDYHSFVAEQLSLTRLTDIIDDPDPVPTPPRDDDSHYFDSYAENGTFISASSPRFLLTA